MKIVPRKFCECQPLSEISFSSSAADALNIPLNLLLQSIQTVKFQLWSEEAKKTHTYSLIVEISGIIQQKGLNPCAMMLSVLFYRRVRTDIGDPANPASIRKLGFCLIDTVARQKLPLRDREIHRWKAKYASSDVVASLYDAFYGVHRAKQFIRLPDIAVLKLLPDVAGADIPSLVLFLL